LLNFSTDIPTLIFKVATLYWEVECLDSQ